MKTAALILFIALAGCASVPAVAPTPAPAPAPTGDPRALYNAACEESRAGRVDAALDLLRGAFAAGWDDLGWTEEDPDLGPVRADPRYRDLRDAAIDRVAAAVAADAPAHAHLRVAALRTLQGRQDAVRAALSRAYARGYQHFVFEPVTDPGVAPDLPRWREGQARRAAWRAEHAGRIRVVVPEVYELANVILALTRYAEGLTYATNRTSDYWAEVAAWFAPVRDHPLVAELDALPLDVSGFYGFRNNAIGYRFAGDRLVSTGVYYQAGGQSFLHARDLFTPRLALVEDFFRRARWAEFHAAHRDYHGAIRATFTDAVSVDAMRRWLDARFPGGGYDAYVVFFSPLTGGFHNARGNRYGDLSEAAMMIAGPNTPGTLEPVAAGTLARIVFTEIDHTYVNPVTDRFLTDIDRVVGPHLGAWNTQLAESGYGTSRATFDEYLTWALFDLWFAEQCAATACDPTLPARVSAVAAAMMTERRGFPRYVAFRDAFLALARAAPADAPIADLYPGILRWMAAQDTPTVP